MVEVPIIDIDRTPVVVAKELDNVCRTVGFFQIVGHGIDRASADDAWSAARAFFDLPLAERLAVSRPDSTNPYGYIPASMESLSRSLDEDVTGSGSGSGKATPGDLKEIFNIGPVDLPTHEFFSPDEAAVYSPNQWPDRALPELRPAWERYYRDMLGLGDRLMALFALALDLPDGFFADKIDQSPSAMRAINYPEQETEPIAGQLRAGAHTDYGTLTILRQDDAPGGLEVLDEVQGGWVPIPSVADAFVINIGDLMARWTNDRWRSTLHRVVNPPREPGLATRRQSMPFFHNANYGCLVECLPTCLAPGESPRYEPVFAGVHLLSKFQKTVS
jgi:isopenicillin N synthase-like dioxygenase